MEATYQTLLEVADLSVGFRQGSRDTLAVDRVSFEIKKGETVALVGEFGLGQIGHRAVGVEAAALSLRAPSIRINPFQGPGTFGLAGRQDPARAWQ